MIHTVSVLPEVETPDKQGANKITYPTVTATLQCRIAPASFDEFVSFGLKQIKVTHKVYFIDNPNIDARYLLEFNSRKFWVLAVKNTGEENSLWEAKCSEGKQGPWA